MVTVFFLPSDDDLRTKSYEYCAFVRAVFARCARN
jgi:hypothetical protein